MMYLIVYPSALEFWKHCKTVPTGYLMNDCEFDEDGKIPSINKDCFLGELEELGLPISFPVHVCVLDGTKKRSDAKVIYHKKRVGFPSQSYIQLSEHICISSPECCFYKRLINVKRQNWLISQTIYAGHII